MPFVAKFTTFISPPQISVSLLTKVCENLQEEEYGCCSFQQQCAQVGTWWKMNKISNTKLPAHKDFNTDGLTKRLCFSFCLITKLFWQICASLRINRYHCYFHTPNNAGNYHKLLTVYYVYVPIILSGVSPAQLKASNSWGDKNFILFLQLWKLRIRKGKSCVQAPKTM